MDPALFRIDWEVLAEVLVAIIVLSFFIERALSIVFEHRLYLKYLKDTGVKEPVALALSLAVVSTWNFDAMAVILQAEQNSWWGYFITAAIVAGGSKASIKLFHDILNMKSQALKEAQAPAKSKSKTGTNPDNS